MRLLNTTTKQLSEFFDEQRPPYAILSHRWGTDEVSLQDLNRFHESSPQHPSSSLILSKAGYRKIEACCNQALCDGLQWAWVDTCCIDKSSSAELTEAINSMFAWYKDAKVCYAFLRDVDDVAEDISGPNSSFRASGWFKRGWTLQELLAPRRLYFFGSDWQPIGLFTEDSKLSDVVSEITSIPSAFLHGLDLRNANVAMKMSWASKRKTTRKEDMAYCLLGIFDVNMPLLYGEGMKAFCRLQEEIMKQTYDHTLLAWGLLPWDEGYSSCDTKPCGVLATSVADFANCGSLKLCPQSANYKFSEDFQMTTEGLRVQLPLRAPRNAKERRAREYTAILDCFTRQDPSIRIAIPLRKIGGIREISDYITIRDGDMFIRTGRALLLSDIAPTSSPFEHEHTSKSIQILVDAETYRPQDGCQLVSLIDFPEHYQYDVNYIHPCYEVKKDTVEPRSLRIQLRSHNELFGIFESGSHLQLNPGSIRYCTYYWSLFNDMLTNIFRGRRPFAQVRPLLDSIIVCVQLTKENHGRRSIEPASFIALLAEIPIPFGNHSWQEGNSRWRLAPLPEHPSQVQSVYHSGMSPGLVGHDSLRLANETLIVRDFAVPDNSKGLDKCVLYKIEVRETALFQPKTPILQRLSVFGFLVICFGYRNRKLFGTLLLYGCVIFMLLLFGKNGLPLYVAIWTLIFMPMIYEVRKDGAEGFGKYEGVSIWLVVVLFSVGISLYPALQPIVGWPDLSPVVREWLYLPSN